MPDNHLISGEVIRLKYIQDHNNQKTSEKPWGHYDEFYFEDCGGSSLIISFGSNGMSIEDEEENIPKFNFMKQLRQFPNLDKLYVRDMDRLYYMNGLRKSAPGINKLILLLQKYTQRKAYSNIITIGASSGGFAALLFGNLLHANKAIAFNPQTVISIEKESEVNDLILTVPVAKLLREANIANNFYQKCLNLRNFIPFSTHAEVHYSTSSLEGVDKRHASYIEHENCQLVPYESSTHLLAYELREKNQLNDIITNSINFINP